MQRVYVSVSHTCRPCPPLQVPNASPTAASASSDMYGAAVLDACTQIAQRVAPFRCVSSYRAIHLVQTMAPSLKQPTTVDARPRDTRIHTQLPRQWQASSCISSTHELQSNRTLTLLPQFTSTQFLPMFYVLSFVVTGNSEMFVFMTRL